MLDRRIDFNRFDIDISSENFCLRAYTIFTLTLNRELAPHYQEVGLLLTDDKHFSGGREGVGESDQGVGRQKLESVLPLDALARTVRCDCTVHFSLRLAWNTRQYFDVHVIAVRLEHSDCEFVIHRVVDLCHGHTN